MVTLLILLNVCHFLADYTWLSNSWMLNAKRFGKPLFPIIAHATVHAFLMWIVIRWVFNTDANTSFWLFWLQLSTHFGIDVLKGRMNEWFPPVKSPLNVIHWVVFGGDQLLHQVVIILMVSIILR